MKQINIRELAGRCDAIAVCSFISDLSDLVKIDYFQGLSAHWNQLFKQSVISINYSSLAIREQLRGAVEALFLKHFPQPMFIHNKEKMKGPRGQCHLEEALIQKCKILGYGLICKTTDHVSILPAIKDVVVRPDADFYYTNGLGYTGCQAGRWTKQDFDVDSLVESVFFPQNNFYFLNVSKIDYIYNLEEVDRLHEAHAADPKTSNAMRNGESQYASLEEQLNQALKEGNTENVVKLRAAMKKVVDDTQNILRARYITMERELASAVLRNQSDSSCSASPGLIKADLLTKEEWRRLIEKVIQHKILDPSFKNLIIAGILHWHVESLTNARLWAPPVYDLISV